MLNNEPMRREIVIILLLRKLRRHKLMTQILIKLNSKNFIFIFSTLLLIAHYEVYGSTRLLRAWAQSAATLAHQIKQLFTFHFSTGASDITFKSVGCCFWMWYQIISSGYLSHFLTLSPLTVKIKIHDTKISNFWTAKVSSSTSCQINLSVCLSPLLKFFF